MEGQNPAGGLEAVGDCKSIGDQEGLGFQGEGMGDPKVGWEGGRSETLAEGGRLKKTRRPRRGGRGTEVSSKKAPSAFAVFSQGLLCCSKE